MVVSGQVSEEHKSDCGVPQGAVLGGKFHNMYTVPLGDIAERNSVQRKGYADDNNAYILFVISVEGITEAFEKLQNCLDQLQFWMQENMLKLNQDKTKIIFLHQRTNYTYSKIMFCILEELLSNHPQKSKT